MLAKIRVAALRHLARRKQPQNHAECDQPNEAGVSQAFHQRHDVAGDVAEERQIRTDQKRRYDRQRQQHQTDLGQAADAAVRNIPVILLSARAGEESRIEGLSSGADDYLVKPFAFAELSARIGALARRPRATQPDTTIRVADLEVDVMRRVVKRGGGIIDLQPREYKLLEYLAPNAGSPGQPSGDMPCRKSGPAAARRRL